MLPVTVCGAGVVDHIYGVMLYLLRSTMHVF